MTSESSSHDSAKPAKSATPKKKAAKKDKTGLSPSTVRVGRRYRASRLEGSYDAIVIGSGIGGLATAATLSKQGKKVVVLEQHYTAGGFTHTYARNGYEWDVGVHYIGDMGHATMGRRLFDYITDGKLQWAAMDDNYDRIILGDESFDFVAGKNQFKNNLKKRFPNESAAIDKYLKMVKEVNDGMRWFTASKLLSPLQQKAFWAVAKRRLPKYFNKITYDVLKEITQDEKLIAVLTGQWGDNGMPPKKSSFIIHCLIAKHYLHGGYYPVGGSSQMAETIIPVIQASGGEVFTYATVEEILIEKKKAVGVRMKDGEEIRAPLVISNAGVFNTVEHLLPEAVSKKFGYPKQMKKIKRSMSHLGMYIGLKGTAEELGLPNTNLWIYPDEKHDENLQAFTQDYNKEFPVVYISFPSAKDPAFLEKYSGRSTIEIVAPAGFDIFEKWKDQPWGKRGEDYDELKEHFTQRMLEALYKQLPQLRGKIDYYETSTPLSTDFFCFYKEGEIYGLDHDPSRFEQHWLRPKTKIPGLYMTGQDVLSCGVVGALMAGVLTTIAITGVKGILQAKDIMFEERDPSESMLVPMPSSTKNKVETEASEQKPQSA